MNDIQRDKIKRFLSGLNRLTIETGIEINSDGEVDIFDALSGRYISALIIEDEAFEVWYSQDDEPALRVERTDPTETKHET